MASNKSNKVDILDIFDFSKKFEKKYIPGSQTQGYVKPVDTLVQEANLLPFRALKGQSYARSYKLNDENAYVKRSAQVNPNPLDNVEEATSVGTVGHLHDIHDLTKVYNTYNFNVRNKTADLPIENFRQKIVNMIQSNQVSIIQGPTGCGKTTQVPQYILDACYETREPCNIVITQPRRIAAITVAKRVSSERAWPLSSLVGYQVGLQNRCSEDTRLTFCTTGVLLQRLINLKNLDDYTHIILDEVHERDLEMDFLLLIIRKMLRSQTSPVKVILMSATFNVDRFAMYFSQRLGKTLTQAPILSIDTNTSNFRINYYYLEQLHNFGPLMLDFELETPECNSQLMHLTLQLIRQLELIEKKDDRCIGGVLIFLPGINEIEDLFTILTTHEKSFLWEVYPLHSTITIEEQERVFKPATNGIRKIILSTNIAESSITVPDIHYVIDFCLTKHLRSDPNSSFTSLQLAWASKTNCIQRAGRCGRVSEGHVYRLVTQVFYECLEEDAEPEMLRCPLERIVLLSKMFHPGEPKALLALALDPPDLSNIEKTLLILKEIGAMDVNVNGVPNEYDGNITFMGRVMARLPIDIHLSKLIILGYVFSLLDDCVIMAAAMSSKSIFSSPFKNRLGAYKSKLMWADQSCSDSVAFLNAYKVWYERVRSGYFERSKGVNSKDWGDQFFIQVRALKDVHDLVQDIQLRLKQMGLEQAKGKGKVEWAKAEMPFVLKFIIAGAFYPNYFVRGSQGGQVDEREAVRKVVGRNPFNTVYYQGWPTGQPGEIYTAHFRKQLRVCARDVTISFDGTNKVYVEFLKNEKEFDRLAEFKSTIPGKIPMAVYRAVKLSQLRGPINVPLLTPPKAIEYAKKCGLNASKLNSLSVNPALRNKNNENKTELPWNSNRQMLPTLQESHLHLHVVHTIDPGHFWAQNADSNTMTALLRVYSLMNGGADAEETMEAVYRREEVNDDPDRDKDESGFHSEPGHMRPLIGPPVIGQIYAAPWSEGDNEIKLYRGRVDAFYPNNYQVEIFFIDFGNTTTMSGRALLELRGRLLEEMSQVSAQAFECVLRGIQPSLLENSNSQWTKAAREFFEKKVNIPDKSHMILFGRVYSVVHGVVSLDLILQNKYLNSEENINEQLIERGFAEPAEESYLSKSNHDIRLEQSKLESDQRINTLDAPFENYQTAQDQIDVIPPPEEICNLWATLRGPFSPLEMKLYNLTRIGIGRQISIEWNSVNSVLLDTYPGDVHERLLIAGAVTQNTNGDRLSLRHTTLMPNIHGLASLITMIFAPSVEIRLDRNNTHYTGALCGLGYYPGTNRSLFPDHDMEIMFDTAFSFEDLKRINSLRRWIDKSLHTEDDGNRLNLNEDRIIKCQKKVREKLLKLVREKRESLDLTSCARPFLWNQMETEFNVDLDENLPDIGQRSFPPHRGAILVTIQDKLKELIKHNQKLQELARGGRNAASHGEDFLEIECRLCTVTLYSARALSLHLLTTEHKDQVTALSPPEQPKEENE